MVEYELNNSNKLIEKIDKIEEEGFKLSRA